MGLWCHSQAHLKPRGPGRVTLFLPGRGASGLSTEGRVAPAAPQVLRAGAPSLFIPGLVFFSTPSHSTDHQAQFLVNVSQRLQPASLQRPRVCGCQRQTASLPGPQNGDIPGTLPIPEFLWVNLGAAPASEGRQLWGVNVRTYQSCNFQLASDWLAGRGGRRGGGGCEGGGGEGERQRTCQSLAPPESTQPRVQDDEGQGAAQSKKGEITAGAPLPGQSLSLL